MLRALPATCLLLACLPMLASAKNPHDLQPFGRLLSTPAQRAVLDQLRENTGKPIPPAPNSPDDRIVVPQPTTTSRSVPVVQPEPDQLDTPLMLNGFVRRSQGPATVWVNQTAQVVSARHKLASGQHTLQTPDGQRVSLKPGQSVLPQPVRQQGLREIRVEEVFGSGQLRIHRTGLASP